MFVFSVTKFFSFCYGHQLPDYEGPCRRLHGHNAILEVEVGQRLESPENARASAPAAVYPGMLEDFNDLKKVVEGCVVDKLDHKYINEVLAEEYMPPTAENMVRWIWMILEQEYQGALLRVRLYETPTSYAELRKETS